MIPSSLVALSYLFVTAPSFDVSRFPQDSCIAQVNPYLAPGGRNVYFTDKTCLDTLPIELLQVPGTHTRRVKTPKEELTRLLWVEREAVITNEPSGFVRKPLDTFFERLETMKTYSFGDAHDSQQYVLQGQSVVPHAEMLAHGHTYGLIAIHPSLEAVFDSLLPIHWRGSLLPEFHTAQVPVPSAAIERVRLIRDSVKFDPVVASLVNNISVPQMKNDIRFLTGEDEKSGILSRHSFSSGIRVAAAWIKERIEETGATCDLVPFLPGFGPNVICKYPSTVNTTETVLLSAHYDSRGSFGSTRAPGGDDDGSGTISILSIAYAIARREISFRKNVELCLFAGEEQGLLGSRAYAKELRSVGADLTLMVQADMLAYHAAGEPAQLGLPDLIGTPEVTQLVANLSAIYSPELSVGFTPACCSDHQSFHEQGFPSTQVFERAGPIADPMYHNSGDLSDREGYDFEQVKSIAKVQFATLLHATGFDLPSEDD
ncbi:hypothetical protein EUX98_g4896 [Antrodiella citrinella]|uniref:Peptide hydrolase n=1 Tax=Antrodiella citrinella TaxID=2447956 RepID=A0A4S4MT27_9APHY|nr:hypothetical protein EUX98_g4896 [Antrodiella citrinella]